MLPSRPWMLLLGLSLWAEPTAATTSYYLRFRPAIAAGLHATLAFDLVHADSVSINRVELTSFAFNGRLDSVAVDGGPAYGDLLNGSQPAALTTLEGQYFFNNLAVIFDSLGTSTTTRLTLTEHPPSAGFVPDEFAAYFINSGTGLPYPTADDLGAGALFAVDVTGDAGGELTVFAPATFIAPDTIAVDGAVAAAGSRQPLGGALRMNRPVPNPAHGRVTIECDVPEHVGTVVLEVIDASGRRVATVPLMAQGPGHYNASWSQRQSNGTKVSAGVYFFKLSLEGVSVVRRVVVAQ